MRAVGYQRSLPPSDPESLVDEVELGIGSLPGERAGVVDRVAGLEQRRLRPGGDDRPGRVEAEHLPRARLGPRPLADLGVDGVHRDGMDLDQHVAPVRRRRVGQLDVDERFGVGRGQRTLVADGAHGSPPCFARAPVFRPRARKRKAAALKGAGSRVAMSSM